MPDDVGSRAGYWLSLRVRLTVSLESWAGPQRGQHLVKLRTSRCRLFGAGDTGSHDLAASAGGSRAVRDGTVQPGSKGRRL